MKVENIESSKGNKIANQFVITDDKQNEYFQSYNSMIVKKDYESDQVKIYLDQKYWNYSNTTGKYRNIFLGETITETKKKIKSGEYILTDLNKQKARNMNKKVDKLGKMIDDWNNYLDKLKQEEEQSLAIFYDYDLEPLPNDLVDMVNEKNKREK